MATEKIFDLWAKGDPEWEKRYEDSIIRNFSDYGRGSTSLREDRGKVFGAGYEVFIIAFFLGLYFDQKKPLVEDRQKRKSLGHRIQYWGNLDSVGGRKAYPKLREFMFIALVAKTNIDFISLEKGGMTSQKAVNMLIQTMEEYANWGFYFMNDKLVDNPAYFYNESAFLELFLAFDVPGGGGSEEGEGPESLD